MDVASTWFMLNERFLASKQRGATQLSDILPLFLTIN